MANSNTKMTRQQEQQLLEEMERMEEKFETRVSDPVPDDEPNELAKIAEKLKQQHFGQQTRRLQIDPELSDLTVDLGYKAIPHKFLASEGLYYPEGAMISIRPCNVEEIRHFSTIDEEDAIDRYAKLNYILEKCVSIKTQEGIYSYKHLKEIDRYYLIFAIRELTFINHENTLKMDITCETCGKTQSVELVKEMFKNFFLDERLKKYYDHEERCLKIVTKSAGSFNVYLPSIGVNSYIRNYIRAKSIRNENFDMSFLKVAPYLFPDWKSLNEKSFERMKANYYTWSIEKIGVFTRLVDILENSSLTSITYPCSCGEEEITAPIRFHGGIKSLFLISNIFDELA
jgi:hypothetical protein